MSRSSSWVSDVSVLSQTLSSLESLLLQGAGPDDPSVRYLTSVAHVLFSISGTTDKSFSFGMSKSSDMLKHSENLLRVSQLGLRPPHSLLAQSRQINSIPPSVPFSTPQVHFYNGKPFVQGLTVQQISNTPSYHTLDTLFRKSRQVRRIIINDALSNGLPKTSQDALTLNQELVHLDAQEVQYNLRATLDDYIKSSLSQTKPPIPYSISLLYEDRFETIPPTAASPTLLTWWIEEHSRFMAKLPKHITNYISEYQFMDNKKHKTIQALKVHFEKSAYHLRLAEARAENDRLQALKDDDMEKYLAFVKESKNSRLLQILNETESFLNQVCVRVQLHKETETLKSKSEAEEQLKAKMREIYTNELREHKEACDQEAKITADGNTLSEEQKQTREWRLMHLFDSYERECEAKRQLDIPVDVSSSSSSVSDVSTVADHPESKDSKLSHLTSLLDSQNFYYTLAHTTSESVAAQSSLLHGGTLKKYQLEGVQWLVSLYNNNMNGILADEMGLGKTIQTIALLCHLLEFKHNRGPHLIIVPLSTISNWEAEFQTWAPDLKCVPFKGPRDNRTALWITTLRTLQFNVCLTTYEVLMLERQHLNRISWNYIIVDEGHRMKNSRSKFVQSLSLFRSKHRLILTGTPIQNSLPELWSLLNFLLPTIFNSVASFEEWFSVPFMHYSAVAGSAAQQELEVSEEERLLIINRLHQVLRPFLLRRQKKDVEKELPAKTEMIVHCDLSVIQRRLYSKIQESGAFLFNLQTQRITGRGLSNTIMQLRKVANHPYLFFDGIIPDHSARGRSNQPSDEVFGAGFESDKDSIWRCSGKFELLDRILPKLKATGHRCLVFSQFTQVMNILETYFISKDFTYIRLDGQTHDRTELLERFNTEDIFIFLLSTRAGGQGLNLQRADTVILFDSDWNPFMDIQAAARAHRIGQTTEVRVLRLLTVAPIEHRIYQRSLEKLDVDRQLIQAGKFNTTDSLEDRKQALLQVVQERPPFLDDPENADVSTPSESVKLPTNQELNQMIARSPEELTLFTQMDCQRLEAWKARFSSSQSSSSSSGFSQPRIPPRLYKSMDDVAEWLRNLIYRLEVTAKQMQNGAGDFSTEFLAEQHGLRARRPVQYVDNLTERQFIRMFEQNEVIVGLRKNSRNTRKIRTTDFSEGGHSSRDSNDPNDNSNPHKQEASSSVPSTLQGTEQRSAQSSTALPPSAFDAALLSRSRRERAEKMASRSVDDYMLESDYDFSSPEEDDDDIYPEQDADSSYTAPTHVSESECVTVSSTMQSAIPSPSPS